ncbi:hypothetical protein BDZ88DRAFT_87008 [Geranomyces variabilis]|nr:hypothetical protein BDZ88DRAFT_87008 [Geranomyces variabilis]
MRRSTFFAHQLALSPRACRGKSIGKALPWHGRLAPGCSRIASEKHSRIWTKWCGECFCVNPLLEVEFPGGSIGIPPQERTTRPIAKNSAMINPITSAPRNALKKLVCGLDRLLPICGCDINLPKMGSISVRSQRCPRARHPKKHSDEMLYTVEVAVAKDGARDAIVN